MIQDHMHLEFVMCGVGVWCGSRDVVVVLLNLLRSVKRYDGLVIIHGRLGLVPPSWGCMGVLYQ